jgi:hypothetical protein
MIPAASGCPRPMSAKTAEQYTLALPAIPPGKSFLALEEFLTLAIFLACQGKISLIRLAY